MVNQQLLDYIKQQVQRGMSNEQIKQSLLDSGWQNTDIDEAFDTTGILPRSKKFSVKLKYILIGSLIFIVLVGIGFLQINKSKEFPKELSPREIYIAYKNAIDKQDWQEIKKYISQENINEAKSDNIEEGLKLIKALTPEYVKIINERIENDKAFLVVSGSAPMGEATSSVEFVKEKGEWKISSENWKSVSSIMRGEENLIGNSSISGTVTLSDINKKGDLFIMFMPSGQIVQGPKSSRYFYVIKKENIISNKVIYKVENVPIGKYFGYATWDIAEPFWEPSWGEGNCPGYAGDYTGGTEEITISANQNINGVDFEVKNYLKPINLADYGKDYKILDLRYEKDFADNTPKLILTAKNTGDKPIREINLETEINGERVNDFFVSGGSILDPGETDDKNIDISSVYKDYLWRLAQWGNDKNLSYYELDLKLISKDNGSVFEKHISIKDLKAEFVKKNGIYKVIFK